MNVKEILTNRRILLVLILLIALIAIGGFFYFKNKNSVKSLQEQRTQMVNDVINGKVTSLPTVTVTQNIAIKNLIQSSPPPKTTTKTPTTPNVSQVNKTRDLLNTISH